MKLDYAGGQVIVGDALCHVLLEYSARLARQGGSENVQIPVVTEDGVHGMAEVVVGPASQLLATPSGLPETDLHDDDAIARITALSAALDPAQGLPMSNPNLDSGLDELL